MDLCGGCLTEDLLIEILKRLPVKSLLRFTSVSKHWRRLIKDPDLVTSHFQFNKSSSQSSLLGIATGQDHYRYNEHEELLEYLRIDKTDQTLEHLKIPIPWRPKPEPTKYKPHISILAHCNGLVLAFDSETKTVVKEQHNPLSRRTKRERIDLSRYIIFNPVARRFKILPESGVELPTLTFEDDDEHLWPSHMYRTLRSFGLGFIDNLVYKIVRITYGVENHWGHVKAYEPARGEVYDSRTGSWREVPVNADLSYEDLQGGVYNSFDGCLYWFGRGYGEIRERYFTLVSFHLVDEIWYETLLPYKSRYGTPFRYEDEDSTQDNEEDVFGMYGVCQRVGIVGGSVVMLVFGDIDRLEKSVWKMNKEDDDRKNVSWTLLYRFSFEGSVGGFCRDGKLLLKDRRWWSSLVVHDSRKIVDDCFHFTNLDCQNRDLVPDFVESLVLLDGESRALEYPSQEKLEEPRKSFWEEDEDLGDLTSMFDENL